MVVAAVPVVEVGALVAVVPVAVRGEGAAVPVAARLAALAAEGAVVVPVLRSTVLPGEDEVTEEPETVDVRRALEASVRFLLSSSDAEMEGRDRWVAVDVELAVVGRRAVEETGGRVGGLLSPPAPRAAVDVVDLVADEVVVTGRRTPVVVFVAVPVIDVLGLAAPLVTEGGEEGAGLVSAGPELAGAVSS